jgi:hypothetical protein
MVLAASGGPRLAELFECVSHDDEIVRMRASDALEKVARAHPEWLEPYVGRLVTEVAAIDQPSVRWHLAQILAEVPLDTGQRAAAIRLLQGYLRTATDWLVLTHTMTSLTVLARDDADLRGWLIPELRRHRGDRRRAVAKRATAMLTRLTGA